MLEKRSLSKNSQMQNGTELGIYGWNGVRRALNKPFTVPILSKVFVNSVKIILIKTTTS